MQLSKIRLSGMVKSSFKHMLLRRPTSITLDPKLISCIGRED